MSFDLNADELIDFKEISKAVDCVLAWWPRIQTQTDDWYYADNGQVVGPVSMPVLQERVRQKPHLWVNPGEGNLWLPLSVFNLT